MNKLLPICITVLSVLSPLFEQAQNFVWMKGSNQSSQQGAYGNVGVATATNSPGARTGVANWQTSANDFWIYGGEGIDFISNSGYLNDLWKYNVTSNQWTWMKGDNIIAQIGVYGTQGTAATGNKPGGRTNAASWTDMSGNLWLFGGYGYGAGPALGYLNDLWKFDPITTQWTWVSGTNIVNNTADYGTINIPAASNVPGPRINASCWKDANGFLYMFGGNGTATSTAFGYLNDLWQYNIGTNTWTWINGSNTLDQNGNYGTLNIASATNKPGSRHSPAVWTDQTGGMWMMGGNGFDLNVPLNLILNDLWKYDAVNNQWTWKGGSSSASQNGVYGTQAVAGVGNIPGARQAPATWADAVGNLWLLGGLGLINTGNIPAQLNDLWKYNVASNQWMWVRGTSLQDQNGTYGSQGSASFGNRPGGRNHAASWTDGANNLWLFGGDGFASTGPKNKMNDLWKIANCYISPIEITVIALDSTLCSGESTSLTANGASNYLWSHNSSTLNNVVITPLNTTTYSVSTTDGIGCSYTSTFTELVSACTGLNAIAVNNSPVVVYPNPSSGSFKFILPEQNDVYDLRLRNQLGQIVLKEKISAATEVNALLPPNIYFYEISSGGIQVGKGKLVVE